MSGLDIVTKQTISKALGRFQCKYSHPFDSLILDITNLIYPKRVWNLVWKYNRICLYFFFLNLNISKAYTFGLKIMRKQREAFKIFSRTSFKNHFGAGKDMRVFTWVVFKEHSQTAFHQTWPGDRIE